MGPRAALRLCTHKPSIGNFGTYRTTGTHKDTQTYTQWATVVNRRVHKQPELVNNEGGD